MEIVITETEGVRQLTFGTGWCQGAMRLDAPERLELAYAVRMFAWLPFHDLATLPDRHLVTLGLGAGSLTRFAHDVLQLRTTAVEIDADVIAACHQHFPLPPEGPRMHLVHQDGAAFVAAAGTRRAIDVLQVDAYDASVEAPALDTEAFYADCRAALRAGGTVVLNLIGRALDVRASVARLRAGLRPRTVWQLPPTEADNVVVVAHTGEPPDEALLQARGREIAQRWDLPAPEWLAAARRWQGPAA